MKQFIKTWKKLTLDQKFAIISLLILGVSVPLAIIAVAANTYYASRAADTYINAANQFKLQEAQVSKPITPTQTKPISEPCVVAGCSSEVCVPQSSSNQDSMCVWKEEYICYRDATCERQSDGQCGWTMDDKLVACLGEFMPPPSPTPGTCGNNVCDPGEADVVDCPVCNPGEICSRRPCTITPGTCPKDCEDNEPIPPIVITKPPDTPISKTQQACEQDQYGTWATFTSTCADACEVLENPLIACGEAEVVACDCGPTHCWNGSECMPNPTQTQSSNQNLGDLTLKQLLQEFKAFFR